MEELGACARAYNLNQMDENTPLISCFHISMMPVAPRSVLSFFYFICCRLMKRMMRFITQSYSLMLSLCEWTFDWRLQIKKKEISAECFVFMIMCCLLEHFYGRCSFFYAH